MKRCLLLFALITLIAGCGEGASETSSGQGTTRVGHVFVIILENEDYGNSFGPGTAAPYLAQTLPAQGALLENYYGTGHNSLDNYDAMISGQGPNLLTQQDCLVYKDFPGTAAIVDGQLIGKGCVYPTSVPSLPDQLEAKNLSWKAYMEDMGNTPSREAATCGHPQLNMLDVTQVATATDQYATRHDPFVYFHSIIDDQPYCDAHVVSFSGLEADLSAAATTANFIFITPNLCHDGHDSPCADGEPGGLISINAFLTEWVPKITASPAFQQDGLLIVTFDEADSSATDSSACCGEGPTTNTAKPGITGLGGGRIGAVLLSPFITPGTVSTMDYNHYSMLRTVEDLFGLPYLGFAGATGQAGFGSDVFTKKVPELPPKR